MKTIIRNFLCVLRRFRMATILNVLGLSIAFAAFMVIMMQVDYDRNFDKFHKNADSIYRVEMEWGEKGVYSVLSRPLIDLFVSSSPHIVAGAITFPMLSESLFSIKRADKTKDLYKEPSKTVYPSFTDVFDFDMVEGTTSALKEPNTVLIPESMARKIFGAESAIGKSLYEKEHHSEMTFLMSKPTSYVVGGVYRDFPRNTIVNNAVYKAMDEKLGRDEWGNCSFNLYVRLDSSDPAVAEEVMNSFMNYYKSNEINKKASWDGSEMKYRFTKLTDLHFTTDAEYDFTPKASRQTILVLIAIALIILFIAGINFTNFSTALAPMRIKSINTQKVLGSSDRILQFSLLVEAVFISVMAYLLCLWIVHGLSLSSVAGLVNADITLSAHPLLIFLTALLSVGLGVLAGIYPAWYITSFPPALVLKGSFGLSPKGRGLRNMLISVQFVASFALIIGAMFMYLQNHYMRTTSLGYDKDELITTSITETVADSKNALTNHLKSFSGILDVTYAEALLASQDQYMMWAHDLNGENIQFQCLPVDPSFLKVMGIQVTDGRDFREDDERTEYGVFIFNERARKEYGIKEGDKLNGSEIVGFMPDVKFASLRNEISPMAFLVKGTEEPDDTKSNNAYIKVKAGSDLHAAMQHVKKSLQKIEPDYPFNIRFYNEVLNSVYEKEESLSLLISLFSLIAVFISIVGVFGLVVFDSEYRRKEIGVRKVMGSTVSQILLMFSKTYIRILLICFVLAAPVAWYAVNRWLENFAYKTPVYWWVFVVAFILVAAITLATVTFQNWHAANENPVKSIKSE